MTLGLSVIWSIFGRTIDSELVETDGKKGATEVKTDTKEEPLGSKFHLQKELHHKS